MTFNRAIKLMLSPFILLYSHINPVGYAKRIGVKIGNNDSFFGKISWGTEPWIITIGDNVFLTNGVKFIAHDGGTLIFRKEIPDLEITKPITIGNDVYVGEDTLFLPGVHVGNKVIIGARSVVTKDIPDNSVAVGVPCRVIKTADEYLEKIKKESIHLGNLKGKKKDIALRKFFNM